MSLITDLQALVTIKTPISLGDGRWQTIVTLQQGLAALNFSPGGIDGICGPQTVQAFTAFQKANGLYSPEQCCGHDTFQKMVDLLNAIPVNKPAPPQNDHKDSPKPLITIVEGCPNYGSRNGVAIGRIINHYTAGTADSAISWFKNPASQVSAHFVIGKDGTIYQVVPVEYKAWHCYENNADSIGIEHESYSGEAMTPLQLVASVALQRWLMADHGIVPANVTAHRFTQGNVGETDCPSGLFGDKTEQAVKDFVQKYLT